jgi:hypothetical protein
MERLAIIAVGPGPGRIALALIHLERLERTCVEVMIISNHEEETILPNQERGIIIVDSFPEDFLLEEVEHLCLKDLLNTCRQSADWQHSNQRCFQRNYQPPLIRRRWYQFQRGQ